MVSEDARRTRKKQSQKPHTQTQRGGAPKFALVTIVWATRPVRRPNLINYRTTIAAFMTILTSAAGCHREPPPLEIAAIIEHPALYEGRVISVHGCYKNGFETSVLAVCTDPTATASIWVVPYTIIEANEKLIPGYHARSTKTEQPSTHEKELEAKLQQMTDGTLTEVVVRGEFQHSEIPIFGHTPGRRNQLILYRVLEAKFR